METMRPSIDEDMTHIYTVEYHSAIKKIELLPFAITWMDLKGIMLSEISQRKTNILWPHLYVESKNKTETPQNFKPLASRN